MSNGKHSIFVYSDSDGDLHVSCEHDSCNVKTFRVNSDSLEAINETADNFPHSN